MYSLNKNYTYSSSPSFGMALHMDEEEIAENIGKYAAEEAKKAREYLEAKAKNVDIFVQPESDGHVNNNRLEVIVQDITPPFVESNIPVLGRVINFVRGLKEQIAIDSKPYAVSDVFISKENLVYRLLDEAEKQKRIFLRSK